MAADDLLSVHEQYQQADNVELHVTGQIPRPRVAHIGQLDEVLNVQ